jgi:Xaa-Pro aminopeptidase
VEVFGMIGGYHAGVCRTAVVGQGPPEAPRIWSHMVECQRLNLELIRPGVSSEEVYRRFTEAFTAHGYEPISFVGHGIGLYLHEEPYLGAFGHWELEEGMVLGVEPVLFVPGRYGLQLKDIVAVTAEGSELLSDVTDTTELLMVE